MAAVYKSGDLVRDKTRNDEGVVIGVDRSATRIVLSVFLIGLGTIITYEAVTDEGFTLVRASDTLRQKLPNQYSIPSKQVASFTSGPKVPPPPTAADTAQRTASAITLPHEKVPVIVGSADSGAIDDVAKIINKLNTAEKEYLKRLAKTSPLDVIDAVGELIKRDMPPPPDSSSTKAFSNYLKKLHSIRAEIVKRLTIEFDEYGRVTSFVDAFDKYGKAYNQVEITSPIKFYGMGDDPLDIKDTDRVASSSEIDPTIKKVTTHQEAERARERVLSETKDATPDRVRILPGAKKRVPAPAGRTPVTSIDIAKSIVSGEQPLEVEIKGYVNQVSRVKVKNLENIYLSGRLTTYHTVDQREWDLIFGEVAELRRKYGAAAEEMVVEIRYRGLRTIGKAPGKLSDVRVIQGVETLPGPVHAGTGDLIKVPLEAITPVDPNVTLTQIPTHLSGGEGRMGFHLTADGVTGLGLENFEWATHGTERFVTPDGIEVTLDRHRIVDARTGERVFPRTHLEKFSSLPDGPYTTPGTQEWYRTVAKLYGVDIDETGYVGVVYGQRAVVPDIQPVEIVRFPEVVRPAREMDLTKNQLIDLIENIGGDTIDLENVVFTGDVEQLIYEYRHHGRLPSAEDVRSMNFDDLQRLKAKLYDVRFQQIDPSLTSFYETSRELRSSVYGASVNRISYGDLARQAQTTVNTLRDTVIDNPEARKLVGELKVYLQTPSASRTLADDDLIVNNLNRLHDLLGTDAPRLEHHGVQSMLRLMREESLPEEIKRVLSGITEDELLELEKWHITTRHHKEHRRTLELLAEYIQRDPKGAREYARQLPQELQELAERMFGADRRWRIQIYSGKTVSRPNLMVAAYDQAGPQTARRNFYRVEEELKALNLDEVFDAWNTEHKRTLDAVIAESRKRAEAVDTVIEALTRDISTESSSEYRVGADGTEQWISDIEARSAAEIKARELERQNTFRPRSYRKQQAQRIPALPVQYIGENIDILPEAIVNEVDFSKRFRIGGKQYTIEDVAEEIVNELSERSGHKGLHKPRRIFSNRQLKEITDLLLQLPDVEQTETLARAIDQSVSGMRVDTLDELIKAISGNLQVKQETQSSKIAQMLELELPAKDSPIYNYKLQELLSDISDPKLRSAVAAELNVDMSSRGATWRFNEDPFITKQERLIAYGTRIAKSQNPEAVLKEVYRELGARDWDSLDQQTRATLASAIDRAINEAEPEIISYTTQSPAAVVVDDLMGIDDAVSLDVDELRERIISRFIEDELGEETARAAVAEMTDDYVVEFHRTLLSSADLDSDINVVSLSDFDEDYLLGASDTEARALHNLARESEVYVDRADSTRGAVLDAILGRKGQLSVPKTTGEFFDELAIPGELRDLYDLSYIENIDQKILEIDLDDLTDDVRRVVGAQPVKTPFGEVTMEEYHRYRKTGVLPIDVKYEQFLNTQSDVQYFVGQGQLQGKFAALPESHRPVTVFDIETPIIEVEGILSSDTPIVQELSSGIVGKEGIRKWDTGELIGGPGGVIDQESLDLTRRIDVLETRARAYRETLDILNERLKDQRYLIRANAPPRSTWLDRDPWIREFVGGMLDELGDVTINQDADIIVRRIADSTSMNPAHNIIIKDRLDELLPTVLEELENARTEKELKTIIKFVQNVEEGIIAGHNIETFDIPVLKKRIIGLIEQAKIPEDVGVELLRKIDNLVVVDTLQLARGFYDHGSMNMQSLVRLHGIQLEGAAHEAAVDVKTNIELLGAIQSDVDAAVRAGTMTKVVPGTVLYHGLDVYTVTNITGYGLTVTDQRGIPHIIPKNAVNEFLKTVTTSPGTSFVNYLATEVSDELLTELVPGGRRSRANRAELRQITQRMRDMGYNVDEHAEFFRRLVDIPEGERLGQAMRYFGALESAGDVSRAGGYVLDFSTLNPKWTTEFVESADLSRTLDHAYEMLERSTVNQYIQPTEEMAREAADYNERLKAARETLRERYSDLTASPEDIARRTAYGQAEAVVDDLMSNHPLGYNRQRRILDSIDDRALELATEFIERSPERGSEIAAIRRAARQLAMMEQMTGQRATSLDDIYRLDQHLLPDQGRSYSPAEIQTALDRMDARSSALEAVLEEAKLRRQLADRLPEQLAGDFDPLNLDSRLPTRTGNLEIDRMIDDAEQLASRRSQLFHRDRLLDVGDPSVDRVLRSQTPIITEEGGELAARYRTLDDVEDLEGLLNRRTLSTRERRVINDMVGEAHVTSMLNLEELPSQRNIYQVPDELANTASRAKPDLDMVKDPSGLEIARHVLESHRLDPRAGALIGAGLALTGVAMAANTASNIQIEEQPRHLLTVSRDDIGSKPVSFFKDRKLDVTVYDKYSTEPENYAWLFGQMTDVKENVDLRMADYGEKLSPEEIRRRVKSYYR